MMEDPPSKDRGPPRNYRIVFSHSHINAKFFLLNPDVATEKLELPNKITYWIHNF